MNFFPINTNDILTYDEQDMSHHHFCPNIFMY